jgi:hypothetical protein
VKTVPEIIEVTPEMVEAATQVLWESGRLYPYEAEGADQLLVEEMLRAAFELRRPASPKTYGFNYEHRGKTYGFDMLALSEESAKERVAAMAEAVFVGKLQEASSNTGVNL